jgi:hypothetical protein
MNDDDRSEGGEKEEEAQGKHSGHLDVQPRFLLPHNHIPLQMFFSNDLLTRKTGS